MQNEYNQALARLKASKPPNDETLISELTVGIDFITDFWRDKYLAEYIKEGGSKIKFVTGNAGSGKSHLLEYFQLQAKNCGYVCVSFSALDVKIHDFKDIYLEVLRQCDLLLCLRKCSEKIIQQFGAGIDSIPEGKNFSDYLSMQEELNPIAKREIRHLLDDLFLKNPLIDNNFAMACSLLTGGILGHPLLEEPHRDLLLAWLRGEKEAKLTALRKLGLSPSKITRYNARHMLRSLVEIIRLAGYAGLVVFIDDLDVLVKASEPDGYRYSKQKREDTYESIRELIDEIDTLRNIMLIFAFHRSLIDNDATGLKSYQALWMRIQNEISGSQINRFTDIVDLDRVAKQIYTPQTCMELSQRLAELMNRAGMSANPIEEERAQGFVSTIGCGQLSLPAQVNKATLEGGEEAWT